MAQQQSGVGQGHESRNTVIFKRIGLDRKDSH